MFNKTFHLANAEQTEQLGAALGSALQSRGLVFLLGELGAGKTTLVRGLLRHMGFTGSTKSPTYTLVEPYEFDEHIVYHFDLYRLADPEELEYIGIDEYLTETPALSLIEWPEKGGNWLPEPHIRVELSYDKSQRQAILYCPDEALLEKVVAAF